MFHMTGVFSPELCAKLIALHATASRQSGFMWPDGNGKYGERIVPSLKYRTDHYVTDEGVAAEIANSLWPVVEHATSAGWLGDQWSNGDNPDAGRVHIERHLVARYDAPDGRFAGHVDNLFPGTRHRQVAVSVGLNDHFSGGYLEIGSHLIRPGCGEAVAFRCDQMHEVSPVTRGTRFVYLTFLYDEAGEAIRQAELAQLTQEKV